MTDSTTQKNSSGKQTVAILVLLIVAGVLLYMTFIFFAKFQAYKKISERLKTEVQSDYNRHLQLNYSIVSNVIHMNNYSYEQSIKTLAHVFAKLNCNTAYNCLINGISYQFKTAQHDNAIIITGYQATLSADESKSAERRFVVPQAYSKKFLAS